MMKSEKEGESKTALTSAVIEEIVDDLVKKAEILREQKDLEKLKKAVVNV
jgi:hypothetical protein